MRPAALLAVTAGVVVFGLVVWLAFWLGFERMRPDLDLESAVALAAAPEVRLADEQLEWELTVEGDPAAGRGPQYASVEAQDRSVCVLTWQTGSVSETAVDLVQTDTDLAATRAVLAAAGLPAVDGERVRVRTGTGETLELLHLTQDRGDGLISATASRAFLGSHHYAIISLICEPGGDVSAQRMHEVLGDLIVDVRIQR